MLQTHKWSHLWGIPGGKIRRGETSETALRREVREETNLEIGDIEFVMVQDCIDSSEFYRPAHFILLNYTARCRQRPEVALNDEAEQFCWVDVSTALKMPLNQPTRTLIETVLGPGRSRQGKAASEHG
jgi:ADP-ribose pyrophosphatase YjhB (NUDIX family)